MDDKDIERLKLIEKDYALQARVRKIDELKAKLQSLCEALREKTNI